MKRKRSSGQSVKYSSTPSGNQLVVSPKRAQWQALLEEHQWLIKQIKKKQSEWKNFVEQMRSLALEIFKKAQPVMVEMEGLDSEIHSLFDEILTKRKLGKKTKKQVISIYEMLQFMGQISPVGSIEEDEDEDSELDELFGLEEENSQESNGTDGGTQEKDKKYEVSQQERPQSSKQLRQTFLRLAEIYHPDKVSDPETQKRHTEIMKEVNRAYKEGDAARLLELERLNNTGESLNISVSNSNDLEKKCQQLEKENSLLKKQYEVLKQELRLIRNTPEGEMVKEYRKAARSGINPIDELLKATDLELSRLKKIRDFVRDFRDRKITIKEFLQGPTGTSNMTPEQMKEIARQMFEEMFYVMEI